MKLAFFGAGRMASALVRGLLRSGVCQPQDVVVSDPRAEAAGELARETGIRIAESNAAAAQGADAVVLCVKPGDAVPALAAAKSSLDGRLLVSIVAGLSLDRIAAAAPGARGIRAMPNTAASVGRSATALAPGSAATAGDLALAREIFSAVGRVFEVAERDMNAITALSGSGPAFIYLVIEAMSDGAVAAGLPRKLAQELAVETLAGAAEMAAPTAEHPAVLRDMVTSPGGTTIAGLLSLEKSAVRSAFAEAVRVAAARAEELSNS